MSDNCILEPSAWAMISVEELDSLEGRGMAAWPDTQLSLQMAEVENSSIALQKKRDYPSTVEVLRGDGNEPRNNPFDSDSSQRNQQVSESILSPESAVGVISVPIVDMGEAVLLAVTGRTLCLKEGHQLLRPKLREKSLEGLGLFQPVSTEGCEDLVTDESIREISSKDSGYSDVPLELNTVLQLLQHTDPLAQRMRPLAEKAVTGG